MELKGVKRIALIGVTWGLSTFVSSAQGSGFYSSRGIGLPRDYVNARSSGMGGVGLAMIDPLTVNHLNPAALAAVEMVRVSGSYVYEGIDLQEKTAEGFLRYSNANSLGLVVPIKRQLALATTLRPYSIVQSRFGTQGTLGDVGYARSLEARGGLTTGSLSLALGFLKHGLAGLSANFNFGDIRQTWRTDFTVEPPAYLDSEDKIVMDLWGVNVTAGVIVQVTPRWNWGAVFSSPLHLRANTVTTFGYGGQRDEPRKKLNIPYSWGIGTGYQVGPALLLGADVYAQPWRQYEVDGVPASGFADSYRYAFGAEFSPSRKPAASFFKRNAYRFGFYHRSLPFRDDSGHQIAETFVTTGLGLPFNRGLNRLDIGLEWGQRGNLDNNPVEEKVARLTVAVSGGERWFQRRR